MAIMTIPASIPIPTNEPIAASAEVIPAPLNPGTPRKLISVPTPAAAPLQDIAVGHYAYWQIRWWYWDT
jgi:hypothetical protein